MSAGSAYRSEGMMRLSGGFGCDADIDAIGVCGACRRREDKATQPLGTCVHLYSSAEPGAAMRVVHFGKYFGRRQLAMNCPCLLVFF